MSEETRSTKIKVMNLEKDLKNLGVIVNLQFFRSAGSSIQGGEGEARYCGQRDYRGLQDSFVFFIKKGDEADSIEVAKSDCSCNEEGTIIIPSRATVAYTHGHDKNYGEVIEGLTPQQVIEPLQSFRTF